MTWSWFRSVCGHLLLRTCRIQTLSKLAKMKVLQTVERALCCTYSGTTTALVCNVCLLDPLPYHTTRKSSPSSAEEDVFRGSKNASHILGVSINGGTQKWMVYNGKSYENGWFGGPPILGNYHMNDIKTYSETCFAPAAQKQEQANFCWVKSEVRPVLRLHQCGYITYTCINNY